MKLNLAKSKFEMTIARLSQLSVILLCFVIECAAERHQAITFQQSVTQHSSGNCSPNVHDVLGNVTIQFEGSGCGSLDPVAVRNLNRFLADFPKTQRRLQELLDKKDIELSAKVKETEEWASKYRDLSERLQEQPADDDLSRRAALLLRDNDLDGAER